MKISFLKTRFWPEVYLLALFSVAIHLICVRNLEYHRDELLYFSLGLHPDFGYSTVPPLIGWVAYIMQNVFGYSVFAVRLFPALLSGVMVLLTAAIARELGGARYASFLAAAGLIISVFFLRSFFLYQPVHIEIFLWTLCIYLIIKFINTSFNKYLIYFGIAAGFALLNKYLASLFFVSLLITIPFTRYRTVFTNKYFWFGLLAAFIIFLPNLLWQVARGFPVFNHMHELYDTQLVYMNAPLFLMEQVLMPFAGSVFTLAGLLFLIFNKRVQKFRFLGYMTVIVITVLMFLRGKSYYTLGVFPFLISSGAVSLEYLNWRKWTKVILPVVLTIITIPVIPMGLPIFPAHGLEEYFNRLDKKYGVDLGRRFEDGSIHSLPQDYADMLGWEELTSIADKAYRMAPDKRACFIYCENYGQAGAITIIGKKYKLPEAICFNESFRYWIPAKFDPDPTSVVYINDEMGDDVKSLFGKITKIGSISDPDAREFGTAVWLCEEPAGSINRFWIERIKHLDD